MTRKEAIELLELYRNWNTGQTSVCAALGGERTAEDDLLDARRAMLKRATELLTSEEPDA